MTETTAAAAAEHGVVEPRADASRGSYEAQTWWAKDFATMYRPGRTPREFYSVSTEITRSIPARFSTLAVVAAPAFAPTVVVIRPEYPRVAKTYVVSFSAIPQSHSEGCGGAVLLLGDGGTEFAELDALIEQARLLRPLTVTGEVDRLADEALRTLRTPEEPLDPWAERLARKLSDLE